MHGTPLQHIDVIVLLLEGFKALLLKLDEDPDHLVDHDGRQRVAPGRQRPVNLVQRHGVYPARLCYFSVFAGAKQQIDAYTGHNLHRIVNLGDIDQYAAEPPGQADSRSAVLQRRMHRVDEQGGEQA